MANKILELLQSYPDFTVTSPSGVRHPVTVRSEDVTGFLKWMPDEVQERLYHEIPNLYKCHFNNWNQLLGEAARRGYLNFEPYLLFEGGQSYRLVFKYNRSVCPDVHNKHFIMCYGPDDDVIYSQSSCDLAHIKYETSCDRCLPDSIMPYYYYINLLQVCGTYDAFLKLLSTKDGRDLVKGFIVTAAGLQLGDADRYPSIDQLQELQASMSLAERYLETPTYFRLPAGDATDICRVIVLSPNLVRVQINTPDGIKERHYSVPIPKTVRDASMLEKDDLFWSLVFYALYDNGIFINFANAYRFDGNTCTIRALNSLGVTPVKTLDDFKL